MENEERLHSVNNNSELTFTTGTGQTGITDEPTMRDEANNKVKINIHSLDYGYNVKVGCQEFAVETVEKLIKNLEAYLKDPNGVERRWMKEKELL